VLKSVNALEMYRQQYHSINYRDVTDFLLFSQAFPRSVLHCLDSAADALKSLAPECKPASPAQTEVDTLVRTLHGSDAAHIIAVGLHEFIDDFQYNLNLIDGAIFKSFFET